MSVSFKECLNQYMAEIQCTGKELAVSSEVSETVISRYRKGERMPSADSEYLKKLSDGITKIAETKMIPDLNAEQVFEKLRKSLMSDQKELHFDNQKVNLLLTELDINISKIAAFMHYDPSYLSKIRNGKRSPAHPYEFTDKISTYIVTNRKEEKDRKKVSLLIGCGEEELTEAAEYKEKLKFWLNSEKVEEIDYVSGFLRKVDTFNLDNYIRAIHFDDVKVPKVPFKMPVSKHYYGLKEMRDGELDFLKHTVLAKSMEPLYICSDMPVEDMAEDKEFARKYMFGLAMVLKKGMHIHIIHDVERPMKDMMLGLENWVPLYMTGQITPYYIKGVQNKVYSHLHYCSGQTAMTGECISGHHDLAHYYLTSRKEEVAVSKKNMEFLLKKASSLMDIYRKERRNKLNVFLDEDMYKEGHRRRVLTAPSLGTMSEQLLEKILKRNAIYGNEREIVLECYTKQKERLEMILSHSTVEDEISEIISEEYKKYPSVLSLAECFLEKDIQLSYDEYLSGIREAEAYAENHRNYTFHVTQMKGFHNIQITCLEGKWCMVSKNRAPAIHFVIHHPKLRYALENMILPIQDVKM